MDIRKRIRIGDLLIENKLITASQLEFALANQKKTRRKLGKTLIDLGYIQESTLLQLLSEQLRIDYIDLKKISLDPEVQHSLPEVYARRFRAIALLEKEGSILVGMADPSDIFAYDEIQKVLKKPIKIAAISESDLLHHLDIGYRKTEKIDNLAEVLDDELSAAEFDVQSLSQVISNSNDTPVVKLLQAIFEDAAAMRASDIHIEPGHNTLRIRQRIDGVLHEQIIEEFRIASALTSRLKLMAGLNISEKRLPQDGRFHIRVQNKNIDIRLSTLPMIHGESVVMRLLDHSQGILNFDKLGLNADLLASIKKLIKKPNGLLLVTGPTGSGKTTTLYTILSEINQPETKIITVEDPVEYRLPRINQVQVHEKIGLTFPSVLRTSLRQDPDIILIGEMRDKETVDIGLRAAMTGHLVFSTLHTNDAISSVARLIDMGAEGFLIASSVQAILAQRLIRRLCHECKQPYALTVAEQAFVKKFYQTMPDDARFYQPNGCHHCNNTGYQGRIGIYELLTMTPTLAEKLQLKDTQDFTKIAKQQLARKTLSHQAILAAMQGQSSMNEVNRIAGELVFSHSGEQHDNL